MKSEPLLQIKTFIAFVSPFVAYAGEQVVHNNSDIEGVSRWVWFFLWLFATAGWAIVHLDNIVEWFSVVTAPTRAETIALWKTRLRLVQNYIASLTAGIAFYFAARGVPTYLGLPNGLPEMVIFIGVIPAAMSGTALWDKLRRRIFMD